MAGFKLAPKVLGKYRYVVQNKLAVNAEESDFCKNAFEKLVSVVLCK